MAERLPQSRLPEGGVNLFQEIKAVSAEAESRGIELIKLSIGQPEGPALQSARMVAAIAIMSPSQRMHEYQDNATPGVDEFIMKYADYFGATNLPEEAQAIRDQEFSRRFIEAHVGPLPDQNIAYLPIPGIKSMLGLITLACGSAERTLTIATMTKPGYPTPKDWAATYLKQNVMKFRLLLKINSVFLLKNCHMIRS